MDLAGIAVEEIATPLADQTDFEHRWRLDPRTGQVVFWTSDTGTHGQNPIEINELNLIPIDPIPSYVGYQDMGDFAEGSATMRPADAWPGRFRDGERSVVSRTNSMSTIPRSSLPGTPCVDIRAQRRAVEWLLDHARR